MAASNIVKGRDIWRIIERNADLDPDWAVESARIHLTTKESSFIELNVFDVNYLEEKKGADEKTFTVQLPISIEATNQMYSEISQLVDLPTHLYELCIFIRDDEAAFFEAKFLAEKKDTSK